MATLLSLAAHILLIGTYGFTWVVAVAGRLVLCRSWKPTGRIMVTGTFHNPNWYLSHVNPLIGSGLTEVILVVDEPQAALERTRFVCPPAWASRLLSRAGAKMIWMLAAGLRYRPDLYMGYHLAPGACSALVAGRLMGRPACYQMTGGPAGVVGGGYMVMDGIEGHLGRSSRLIEAMALCVIRQFELVVVRGSSAREFLRTRRVGCPIAVITGSVGDGQPAPDNDRDIDILFVGRLSLVKQIDQFIAVVDAVRRTLPSVRAAIVGDGPLMVALQAHAQKLGLATNLRFFGKRNDVESFMARSKVFILTSKSEGLPIAVAEAMHAGAVPVVADVGELRDLITDGVNGYLIEPNNIDEYARKALGLLQEGVLWNRCSCRAVETATRHCGVGVVTAQWRQHLQETIHRASGYAPEEYLK